MCFSPHLLHLLLRQPFIIISYFYFSKFFNKTSIYINLGCIAPLGMESRAIADSQITASTEWDANHAASRARLNVKLTGSLKGGWSARVMDYKQWLQVDLVDYTTVTRVATQGRNAFHQWLTKFRLLYSDDGVVFHLYKERGDTSPKVNNAAVKLLYFIHYFFNPSLRISSLV